MWGSLQDLLFLSPVTRVTGYTVDLPSSHPFNSGFQPSEKIACVRPTLLSLVSSGGCLPCLPVTCDLFYGEENQLKFEGEVTLYWRDLSYLYIETTFDIVAIYSFLERFSTSKSFFTIDLKHS